MKTSIAPKRNQKHDELFIQLMIYLSLILLSLTFLPTSSQYHSYSALLPLFLLVFLARYLPNTDLLRGTLRAGLESELCLQARTRPFGLIFPVSTAMWS